MPELARLYDLWQLYFEKPRPADLVAIDPAPNLEDRLRPDGRTDQQVVTYFRRRLAGR